MTILKWQIDESNKLRDKWREELGDEEFDRRAHVAAERRRSIPEWQQRVVFGGQFESLAMRASQEVFDRLENKPYTFWLQLLRRLISESWRI